MCPECDRKQGKFSKNFSAMGNLFSSRDSSQQSGGTPNTAPKVIKKKTRKPPTILELEVAHYTPPSFPLMPIVTDEVMSVCRQSWARILGKVLPSCSMRKVVFGT